MLLSFGLLCTECCAVNDRYCVRISVRCDERKSHFHVISFMKHTIDDGNRALDANHLNARMCACVRRRWASVYVYMQTANAPLLYTTTCLAVDRSSTTTEFWHWQLRLFYCVALSINIFFLSDSNRCHKQNNKNKRRSAWTVDTITIANLQLIVIIAFNRRNNWQLRGEARITYTSSHD